MVGSVVVFLEIPGWKLKMTSKVILNFRQIGQQVIFESAKTVS